MQPWERRPGPRQPPRQPLQRRQPAPRRLQLIAALGSIVFSLSVTGLIYMISRTTRSTFNVSGVWPVWQPGAYDRNPYFCCHGLLQAI